MKYILGVDGGNTKTDYLLFDENGEFIDGHRSGTCSHEALKDSFEGTYRVMGQEIETLLSRNNIKVTDIIGAAFGLAGADVKDQKDKLNEVIKKIGFKNFEMDNDGFLGLKAAAPSGYGVCSINGTGTVSVGIGEDGKHVQVGGVGYISGDEAGGAYLTRRTFQAVYDELYRMGPHTILTDEVLKILEISNKEEYLSKIIWLTDKRMIDRTKIIKLLFACANKKDQVASNILRVAGACMGQSIAGCINELNFTNEIPFILAGSVWANATAPDMFEGFKNEVEKYTKIPCKYIVLNTAPACGAVIWAAEVAMGSVPTFDVKKKIIDHVNKYQESQFQTK